VRTPNLIWRLFPAQIAILLAILALASWYYGTKVLQDFETTERLEGLEIGTLLLEPRVTELVREGKFRELGEICRQSDLPGAVRTTVVDRDGLLLCDSSREPGNRENLSYNPEIKAALSGEVGTAIRFNGASDQDMLYVAIPLIANDRQIWGVLRNAVPVTSPSGALRKLNQRVGLGLLLAIITIAWLTYITTRRISRALGEITTGALRYAGGDFSRKITVSGPAEVVSLAQAFNHMVAQLDKRLKEEASRRNELETVVSSMVEGVIAFDHDANILYMNDAAALQLDVSRFEAQGGNILEVVRNIDLLRFIQKTMAGAEPSEGTVVLNRGREDERILQMHGAQLADPVMKRLGALIVCNDVTRLLRLENLRRDFVANVSHELKTPITSIKGYVETLLYEAGEAQLHFREFLGIILKHANRLQAIVEDLLTLSRIEQESRREEIRLKEGSIKEVLAEAIEVCATKAADKLIEISLHCPDDLSAVINPPLLEQAISNLLDNAIKYSRPESMVSVEAESLDSEVLIRVSDTGPGIAAQHLPRLFERFYVIDKARSRKMGGTGLGLSIVKHIVQSHGGKITANSESGRGSIFTIHLPRSSRDSLTGGPAAQAPVS